MPRQDTAPPAGRCPHRPVRTNSIKSWDGVAPSPCRPSAAAPSRQGTRALPYKNIAYYPGRTGSSAPTKECLVGRDPCVPPHTAPLAKNPVTGVAIRTPLRRAALAGRGKTSASTAFGASGRRPLRRAIGKRRVGVGLPDDPHRTCTKLLALRRAGCPQPAARQPLHPPGRARGTCPTKILRITPGGQDRPPLRRNAL